MTIEWTEELKQELRAQADVSGDLDTTLRAGELTAVLLELDRRAERLEQAKYSEMCACDRVSELDAELVAAEKRIGGLERTLSLLTDKLAAVSTERDNLLIDQVLRRPGPTEAEMAAALSRRRRGRR